jgi:hypothetical protein
MYCPRCKEITTCKAIPGADVTHDARDYSQRKYYTKHSDIQFFQRGRKCLACDFKFQSGEVSLKFLEELVELRVALGDIKRNAETYTQQSAAAAESLEKLSQALGVLRALKVYKKAGA